MFKNHPRLLTGHGGIFICSKLEQTLSEMEVGTSVRIQRVIWEVPLAVFQGWNYPEPSFISVFVLNNSRRIIVSSSQLCSLLCFPFSLVSSPPRSIFCLNHVKKVRKRCSHSRFTFQAIILGFFDRNVGLCCSCFSVAIGDRTKIIAGSLSCAPPSYSKANLGITHTESRFAGYTTNDKANK